MKEYVTDAIVLGRTPRGEWNLMADLLTEELGRVEARVVGGARPLSKLSRHLNVGNRCVVRLVARHALTLTDIEASRLTDGQAGGAPSRNAPPDAGTLETLFALRALLPHYISDPALWTHLTSALAAGALRPAETLGLLGYDPRHARCAGCGAVPVARFHLGNQEFACNACSVQFPEKEVVLLNQVRYQYTNAFE